MHTCVEKSEAYPFVQARMDEGERISRASTMQSSSQAPG